MRYHCRLAHSHFVEDQLFLPLTLSRLITFFHFVSEMERGKSLNCCHKQAAYYLLFPLPSQVMFGLAHVSEREL